MTPCDLQSCRWGKALDADTGKHRPRQLGQREFALSLFAVNARLTISVYYLFGASLPG